MNRPISIGVVGCGYWGPLLVRNFTGLPDCKLEAICDMNEARLKHLQGLYPNAKCLSDYNRFLTEPKVDAVVIATPVRNHYPLAKAALLAGKHVFLEKP